MILKQIDESVEFIQSKTKLKPTVAVVLGSGLGQFADSFKSEWKCEYSKIPQFKGPGVEGHKGCLHIGKLGNVVVAVMQGRIHYYEGHSISQVVHPIRTLIRLGVKAFLFTNAAGGLDIRMSPGEFMLINDHINLMGTNPLIGPNENELGPRFPDMTEAYDKGLQHILRDTAASMGFKLQEGVYVGLPGPSFETPSEIKYLQNIGGSAVGMSTVPEVIAAHHMGVLCGGISCITNMGAGIGGSKLSHEDVTETSKKVGSRFSEYLTVALEAVGKYVEKPN